MKVILILLVFALPFMGIAQNKGKEEIKINKELDEHGNIIRYDSSYTYSSFGVDAQINIDSIMQMFNHPFQFPGFMFPIPEQGLNNSGNHLDLQLKEMLEMMKQFENSFFKQENQQVPGFNNPLPQKQPKNTSPYGRKDKTI